MLQQAVQAAIWILNAVQGKKKIVWVMPENVSQQKERGERMGVRKEPSQNKGTWGNKHPQQDWDVITPACPSTFYVRRAGSLMSLVLSWHIAE